MRYAIEVTGYGKRRRYIIRQIVKKGLLVPVSRPYKTLEAAQDAAVALGLVIDAVGDLYGIL